MATYMKLAHQAPKIETIILNKDYAISLNPNYDIEGSVRNQQYEPKYTDPIKQFVKHTKIFLLQLKGSAYKLRLESSPTGRLHWHGYIRIYNIEDWVLRDLSILKQLGTFCIKAIEDEKIWKEYVEKQSNHMPNKTITSLLYA